MKWYGNYGRKGSRTAKRNGKHGRKVSRIVKRGNIWKKTNLKSENRENTGENCEKIVKI